VVVGQPRKVAACRMFIGDIRQTRSCIHEEIMDLVVVRASRDFIPQTRRSLSRAGR
jgi:hypothetical protein